MTRRLFLHVGLPKTGTTYLQDGIWEHRDTLATRGLLVPGRHRRRHLIASLDLREDPKLARRSGDVEHPWQDLLDEVHAHPGDALISHEFFASASPGDAARAVREAGEHELHVVVTAREMVSLGLSRWQEWVKNGASRPLSSYPPETVGVDEWGWASFDLAEVLRSWGSAVPAERIHVIPVRPGAREPGELWRRFLGVLGIDATGLEVADQPQNTSLGVVEAELLRRVNGKLEGFGSAGDRGRWIRGYLGEGTALPRTGERFAAPQPLTEELVRRGHEAVDLLREGRHDVVGEVDWLVPVVPEGRRVPREVEDSELLEAATSTIAAMLADLRAETRHRKALQAELAGAGSRDDEGTVASIIDRVARGVRGSRRGRGR